MISCDATLATTPVMSRFIFAFHLREAAKSFLPSLLQLGFRLLILFTVILEKERNSSLCPTGPYLGMKSFDQEQGVSLEHLKLGPVCESSVSEESVLFSRVLMTCTECSLQGRD